MSRGDRATDKFSVERWRAAVDELLKMGSMSRDGGQLRIGLFGRIFPCAGCSLPCTDGLLGDVGDEPVPEGLALESL